MGVNSDRLNKSYRNKMAFSSSEPTSQSKPKVQNLIPGLLDPPGGTDEDSSEELRYEDCISDDESSSNIEVLDIGSTSVVLRSLHRNIQKSPGFNWDYELIIDSGANASLVCERRLLTKLVHLKSKVRGIDDTLLLDVKGQGCLRIRLDNGMTIDIEGVLYVPDSKFNLISVDSITKSTHFEVLFGKTDCLLTDPNNPEFSQVLGYNHGGLYHLAGKCVLWDHGQTTNLTREFLSVLTTATATTILYK